MATVPESPAGFAVYPCDIPPFVAVRPYRAHFGIECSRCGAVHAVYFANLRKDPAAIQRIVGSHGACIEGAGP